MTSQRRYSFSFPDEMDCSIDFLFVRTYLFLGLHSKKSDIKILVYTKSVSMYQPTSTTYKTENSRGALA